MSLLVAITQWEPEPWIERFRRLMPERAVVALGEPFEPAEIRYVASWKHPPGSLAALPSSPRAAAAPGRTTPSIMRSG